MTMENRLSHPFVAAWAGVPFVGAWVRRSSDLGRGSFPAALEAGNSSRDVGLFSSAHKGVK